MLVIPFFTIGGAERIFLSLLRKWRSLGTRMVVVTTLRLPPEVPNRIDQVRSFTPHAYQLAYLFEGREDLQSGFFYFLLKRYQPDFILTAGSEFFYRLLPAVRRQFPEVLVIDQLFNDEVHFHSNRIFRQYIDCTIVPGRRIARRLIEEHGESAARVAVIPHGVKLPGRIPGLPALPRRFENRPLVGFFGRHSPEKGALDFVQMAARIHRKMPEVRFVMTGEGPQHAEVRKKVRRLGLQGVLHLPGFVEDVRSWIAACDVVTVPSRLDGMPLVIFEAQGMERCVVASRTGSIPEVIEDGETGLLCDPGDIDGFAAGVIRLLESGEERERLGKAARERVLREYTEEVMVARYEELFGRLLAERKVERL